MAWRATTLLLSVAVALHLVIAGREGEASETGAEVDQSTDSRCQVSFTIWRVEEDGTKHLAEGRIWFSATPLIDNPTARDRRSSATETGRCVLKLPAGEWRIRKTSSETSPYWFDEVITVPTGQREQRVDLTLLEARRLDLKGRVVRESDGSPVRGISVSIESDVRGVSGYRGRRWTNENGEFTVSDVWEDRAYTLKMSVPRSWVETSGPVPHPALTVARDTLLAGQFTWSVDVPGELPTTRLRLFLDGEAGPVPFTADAFGLSEEQLRHRVLRAARVEIDPETGLFDDIGGEVSRYVATDGLCRFRNLSPGVYAIRIVETAWDLPQTSTGSSALSSHSPSASQTFHPVHGAFTFIAPPHDAREIVFDVVVAPEMREFELEGRVVDHRGRPVAGALVGLGSGFGDTSEKPDPAGQTATSRDDGSFTLSAWPRSTSLHVEKDNASARYSCWPVPGRAATLVLDMRKPGPPAWLQLVGALAVVAVACTVLFYILHLFGKRPKVG